MRPSVTFKVTINNQRKYFFADYEVARSFGDSGMNE